jgi:hypothetical protein
MFLSPLFSCHRPLRREKRAGERHEGGRPEFTHPASGTASISIKVKDMMASNRAEKRMARSYRQDERRQAVTKRT